MRWLNDCGRDLRMAARTLRRQPGFTLLAVTILALGLGAATAMFSVLDVLLLRPLPFPHPERLVRITRTMAGDSADSADRRHSPGGFFAYRALGDVFEGVAAINLSETRLATAPGQAPEETLGTNVTPDYFRVFQVTPRLGRLFSPEEYLPGRDRVVLLSTQLWEARFAADPAIVGRRIQLGGEPVTVVGVMPPELHDPLRYWARGLLWRPLAFPGAAENDHESYALRLLARLAPGVTIGAAQAAVNGVAARLDADHQTRSGARLGPPQESGALDVAGGRVTWLSMGLALLVLLIACVNLAGVQLARLAGRGHDLAVRAALGAGRGRLMRELVTESLLLSVVAGAVSVLVAHWCTATLASRITTGWRRPVVGVPAHLDGRALGFAMALVLVTAVAVGSLPAWLSARGAVARTLRQGGTSSRAAGSPRLRQGLVVAEMALALVLLAAGGLFLRGLQRFVDRGPGWAVRPLLTARLTLDGPAHRGEPGAAFLEELQRRLAALPGVETAALTGNLPLYDNSWPAQTWWVQGRPRPRLADAPAGYANEVSPDYFSTLGLSLREGRLFTSADRRGDDPIVINETMARRLWPGGSAIGKRLGPARGDEAAPGFWKRVVGVVSDARFAATLSTPASLFQVYQPIGSPESTMVLLRAATRPEALSAAVRDTVAGLDPEVLVSEVIPAQTLVDRGLGNFALLAWTLFAFAALGVVLSALGVYGLFAGYVVQRTREIGVRIALGAQTGQVLGLMMGKGLRLALVGGALGVAGALALFPILTAVAAELPARDPTVVILLAALLVAVALFACWLPARRAAALDPVVALKGE